MKNLQDIDTLAICHVKPKNTTLSPKRLRSKEITSLPNWSSDWSLHCRYSCESQRKLVYTYLSIVPYQTLFFISPTREYNKQKWNWLSRVGNNPLRFCSKQNIKKTKNSKHFCLLRKVCTLTNFNLFDSEYYLIYTKYTHP